ncbi:hypothetical protein DXT89_18635 [Agrobacterium vitis]|uniref:Uncharacterized protein n=2 Tax=Agrobacterium vitis TaxID=373 RepID=A0A368NI40_AGRVI|nr:hypothetical protein DXM22_16845 [Agrobacterium vitis]KAA3525343.1 hypothetical protein DXT89_18635 [Agrobacterium vitis]RCU50232.1 hypothetical protein ASB66_022880 [Agrobacterium vitis]
MILERAKKKHPRTDASSVKVVKPPEGNSWGETIKDSLDAAIGIYRMGALAFKVALKSLCAI